MDNENEKKAIIFDVNLSDYKIPEVKNYIGKKYILNGEKNEFFRHIKDRYTYSRTNSGIINSYINYIVGEGLIDERGSNVRKYLSKRDLILIVTDFKLYGQFTLEIIWSQGSKLLKIEPEIVKIKHIPTSRVGLNVDEKGAINGYWYCFDWKDQIRYKPKFYHKFDGSPKYKTTESGEKVLIGEEFITISRITDEPYFPQPDYISGIQFAQLEQDLLNMMVNDVQNGFSAGTVITVEGQIPSEDVRESYTKKLVEGTTGTTNKNKVIVAYTNGFDKGANIKVEKLQIDQLDQRIQVYSEEAVKGLMAAHGVTNPILFGVKEGSGFSNNADEMVQATKSLYRSNINPLREVIIDGLESILKIIDPNISLKFKDFEDLQIGDSNQKNDENL